MKKMMILICSLLPMIIFGLEEKTTVFSYQNKTLSMGIGLTNASITFNLEIENGLEEVVADELRLQQMLFHLLDNALKLAGLEGDIGLKVNRWEKWIAFTVWDTGMVIPEESQTLIFQQCQQEENRLTGQLEGTVLGLLLTQ